MALDPPRRARAAASLWATAVVSTWLALAPGVSRAQPADPADPPAPEPAAEAACQEAFEAVPKLRAEGQLVEAREQARACFQESCPEAMQSTCRTWDYDIADAIPTVLIEATIRGTPVTNVRVLVDGQELASELDGQPLPVDPGPHVFHFEHPSAPPAERRVTLEVGRQDRLIRVRFAAGSGSESPAPPPPPPPPAPAEGLDEWDSEILPLAYVNFGIATITTILGIVTGIVALVEASDLSDVCENDVCPAEYEEDLAYANQMANTATGSFITAGGTVAIGIIVWLAAEPSATPASGEELPDEAVQWQPTLQIQPVTGSVTMGLRGRF